MHLVTDFHGDPNLGLYGFATDSYCIVGGKMKSLKKALKVPAHVCKAMNTDFAGLFYAGNSSGIVAHKMIEETETMKKDVDVFMVRGEYTALGNLVLMNDNGIVLSPLLRKAENEIKKHFGLPCEVCKIANLNIVGSVGIATNRGCLVHPKVKGKELKTLNDVLDVDISRGTVNFGSPFVGAGIIANANGFIVSRNTTGIEMGVISEALGFVK